MGKKYLGNLVNSFTYNKKDSEPFSSEKLFIPLHSTRKKKKISNAIIPYDENRIIQIFCSLEKEIKR
jgi:hypothetical protein